MDNLEAEVNGTSVELVDKETIALLKELKIKFEELWATSDHEEFLAINKDCEKRLKDVCANNRLVESRKSLDNSKTAEERFLFEREWNEAVESIREEVEHSTVISLWEDRKTMTKKQSDEHAEKFKKLETTREKALVGDQMKTLVSWLDIADEKRLLARDEGSVFKMEGYYAATRKRLQKLWLKKLKAQITRCRAEYDSSLKRLNIVYEVMESGGSMSMDKFLETSGDCDVAKQKLILFATLTDKNTS